MTFLVFTLMLVYVGFVCIWVNFIFVFELAGSCCLQCAVLIWFVSIPAWCSWQILTTTSTGRDSCQYGIPQGGVIGWCLLLHFCFVFAQFYLFDYSFNLYQEIHYQERLMSALCNKLVLISLDCSCTVSFIIWVLLFLPENTCAALSTESPTLAHHIYSIVCYDSKLRCQSIGN